jgi:hypothetical protein
MGVTVGVNVARRVGIVVAVGAGKIVGTAFVGTSVGGGDWMHPPNNPRIKIHPHKEERSEGAANFMARIIT